MIIVTFLNIGSIIKKAESWVSRVNDGILHFIITRIGLLQNQQFHLNNEKDLTEKLLNIKNELLKCVETMLIWGRERWRQIGLAKKTDSRLDPRRLKVLTSWQIEGEREK